MSDLRHESLVWRPCWISGGYRLEAASRPIALYIVGIREAQGRNQHFYVWYRNIGRANSGWRWRTVLADSDGLAIAPQDTIHLPDHGTSPKCMFNAKPEIMAMRSLLCSLASILRDDITSSSSDTLQYMRPAFCIRPSNVTRHGARKKCLQAFHTASLPLLPLWSGRCFSRRPLGFSTRSLADTSPHTAQPDHCNMRSACVLGLSTISEDIMWLFQVLLSRHIHLS